MKQNLQEVSIFRNKYAKPRTSKGCRQRTDSAWGVLLSLECSFCASHAWGRGGSCQLQHGLPHGCFDAACFLVHFGAMTCWRADFIAKMMNAGLQYWSSTNQAVRLEGDAAAGCRLHSSSGCLGRLQHICSLRLENLEYR